MSQNLRNVVLIGNEATPGTVASSFPWHLPIVGEGFKPVVSNNVAQIRGSQSHPYITAQHAVGLTANAPLSPDVNVSTIRDLLYLITPVSGALPFFSIAHANMGISSGQEQMLGAVVASMTMNFARSGTPDDSMVLTMALQLECMKFESTTGVSAGTQGTGNRFLINQSSFTLNSVAALQLLSFEWQRQFQLYLGPVSGSDKRTKIELERVTDSISLSAEYDAQTWRSLTTGKTEFQGSVILATGTANETVTLALRDMQVTQHTPSGSDTVTEQITCTPVHDGTNDPVGITHGSAIGATVLNA